MLRNGSKIFFFSYHHHHTCNCKHKIRIHSMRETISNHFLHVRTYPSNQNDVFKPNVNVSLLTKLIHVATDLLPVRELKGKRKASRQEDEERSPKRARRSRNSASCNEGERGHPQLHVKVSYPAVWPQSQESSPSGEGVPILRHLLNIHYESDDAQAAGFARPDKVTLGVWNREDEALQDALLGLSESSVDLGRVRITQDDERVVISTDHRDWLLLVPSLRIDADSNDIQSESAADLLLATRTLQLTGRLHLESNLKVIPPSESSFFSLQLEYTASIVLPAILEPFPFKRVSKKDLHAREDARRRFLTAAWLSNDTQSETHNKPITVSSFYSTMGPAPPLASQEAIKAMQPAALSSTLLPFQRRSVAWLLAREGMSVTSEGVLVPQTSSSQFSFWNEIKEGERTWYFNRLSGELAKEAPELPTIYGAMLAEEPGLGKTVETIALMLLNPTPADWNPTLTRWDPNGHLHVKAIKVRVFSYSFVLH